MAIYWHWGNIDLILNMKMKDSSNPNSAQALYHVASYYGVRALYWFVISVTWMPPSFAMHHFDCSDMQGQRHTKVEHVKNIAIGQREALPHKNGWFLGKSSCIERKEQHDGTGYCIKKG